MRVKPRRARVRVRAGSGAAACGGGAVRRAEVVHGTRCGVRAFGGNAGSPVVMTEASDWWERRLSRGERKKGRKVAPPGWRV